MKQLVQVVGPALGSPFLLPPGLAGRDGTALLRPDSGGVLGDGWFVGGPLVGPFMLCRRSPGALGVDAVRAIFCWRRESRSRLRTSLTEAAEP